MLDLPKAVPGFSQHAVCSECKKRYQPHPRLGNRQRTCGADPCLHKHRARYQRRYRRKTKNLDAQKDIRKKVKDSRPADYWKTYRRNHLKSTQRNRELTKLRMRLRRSGLQRKLDIVEVFDPSGYFNRFYEFATSHRLLLEGLKATSELQEKGA
jgi:hypothetical protein